MTTLTQTTSSAAVATRRRGILSTGLWRARFEILQYFRSGDTLFFTFLFPVFMLALFSTIFGAEPASTPHARHPSRAGPSRPG